MGILGGDLDRAEAPRELQAVLDETAPTNPADWTVKDVPEAPARLHEIGCTSS